MNMIFYATMIDHYEDRLKDTSLPLFIRKFIKESLAMYQIQYDKIKLELNISHKKTNAMLTQQILNVPASLIIRTAEELKAKNLYETPVSVKISGDRVIISDQQNTVLSWTNRPKK